MTALANYAENLLLNFLMNTGTATRPTAWYVGLHTADPGETGATAEVSGNGYARQSCTFTTATTGTLENVGVLTFGPNTTAPWGTITHCSIWDAVSGGNCLYKGALAVSKAVGVSDSLLLAAGDLDVTLD